MSWRRATATRNAVVNAEAALFNGGSAQVRTTGQPTNVSDSPGGTLLGTLTFPNPAFGSGSNGVATANAITGDNSADNSGTAGHARILDNGGSIVGDATCAQGGGDFNFDNNVIVAGGQISASSMTMTAPI